MSLEDMTSEVNHHSIGVKVDPDPEVGWAYIGKKPAVSQAMQAMQEQGQQ